MHSHRVKISIIQAHVFYQDKLEFPTITSTQHLDTSLLYFQPFGYLPYQPKHNNRNIIL